MNKKIIIIFLILILIGLVFYNYRKENFTNNINNFGNISSSKFIFDKINKHSTDVIELNGNTNETLVFIHNTPFDMQIWMPLFNYTLLNSNNNIPNMLAYDMLGHATGWVKVPDQYNDTNINNYAWSMDEFVNDLKQIYDKHIKNGKIKLIGYGTGGKVAQAFSLKYPNLINSLYIMNISISSTKIGIDIENNYLVNWINNNPNVSYLTMEETFIQYNLCLWFNINKKECSNINNLNNNYKNTPEYLLAQKLYRIFNCATYLQMNKLVENVDLINMWSNNNVDFPVYFLIADNDHYTNIMKVKEDLKIISKNTPKLNLTYVKGTHIFPIINTQFLYEWIIKNNNMLDNTNTISVINYN